MGPRQWFRLGGVAGIVYVAASVVGGSMGGSMPDLGASAAKIALHFATNRQAIVVGGIVTVVGFAFVLWWLGSLRHGFAQIDESRDPLGWIAITGGITSATFGLLGTLGNTLLAILAGQPGGLGSASVVRALFDLSSVAGGIAFVLFAAFVPAFGVAAVRRGIVGPWLGWLSVVVGGVAATGGASRLAIGNGSAWDAIFFAGLIGFGIVVLIVSVQMIRGQGLVEPGPDLQHGIAPSMRAGAATAP